MTRSILDAIKLGHWNFEPDELDGARFQATEALPGTSEKLSVLAERVQSGQPLWHPRDRLEFATDDA